MMRRLLVFGMLTGLFAGLVAFAFASVAGEPQVDAAIAIEEAAIAVEEAPAPATGDHAESAEVSRNTQKGVGLAVATGLYGVAMGGLFAIACAVAYGRIGTSRMRSTSAAVAAGGLVAVALVPFAKYPANPPAVGDPGTIDRRTGLYVVLVAVAVLAALIAAQAGRVLAARVGPWNAALAAAGVFTVLVTVAAVLLPVVNEVPDSFPPELLWRFRLSSLGAQALVWVVLGLGFGPLADRVLNPAPSRAARSVAASAASSPSTG
ncbi:putative cobalt transporter subunit (CbtA) [Frankia sp. EI5c]|uniref:CbtA family protein n=1 Tax=Frankia sp. EI5c TaxID=683316 RepID=UPI0007C35FF4|nr:CbtA family protein [Frankia sp. EI5c]OAA28496.1 putative cobalt transporter subunit (CbtA) [Frankia sp. EI5c]